MTLEDTGTITLQVGSCSSEAQLKVTGGHSLSYTQPMPVDVFCFLAPQLFEGNQEPQNSSWNFALGMLILQCVVSQARIDSASWKS